MISEKWHIPQTRRVGTLRLPFPLTSAILVRMGPNSGSASVSLAVFSRGPMDGQVHPIEGDTDELSVVMTDGQQQRYVRTDDVQRLPNGGSAVVFDWVGRYYGPR